MKAGSVLVVDDAADSRELLTETLTSEGYSVRAADSGELALASVSISPPEVILLDMRMPGMDGLEVCKRLKANPASRDIPVIFLSASNDFGDRVGGLEAGAVDFVNKPFRREELLARLNAHLELARLRKDLEQRVVERTEQLQAANDQLKDELERRRRTEAELRESEQRFRSIADTAPALLFMSDSSGNVTYVSQWALTFTGWTREQFTGKAYLELIHPQDLPRAMETFTAAVKEQKFYQIEYRNQRCDGEYRWLAETAKPRFVNDQYVGHIGVVFDITDLRRSQEQAVANQKLESLGVLTAGIAHTFNNLVSTILAHSELALEELPDESQVKESVTTIGAVALRASEIVNLLMAYAGRGDADTAEPVELSSLIHATVQLLEVSTPRVTSLKLNLAEESTRVWANAGQIRQVLLNIIVNASEALEERPGTVTVSTKKVSVGRSPGEFQHPQLGAGAYVLVEVADTGCGMTEEVKARIFDPFFSTKSLGRGLGLASVQGIVLNAGGAVSVTTSPGKGSQFQVLLPLWNGSLEGNPENEGGKPNHSGIVLLADDEAGLRLGAATALEREGFSVMATGDGLSAIQLFERHHREIEAVVLDAALPGLSGQDVCAEIRGLKPHVPVLFTSEAGADEVSGLSHEHVLLKPYQLPDLVHTLRQMMTPH